ncbi:hypothetical protein A2U01_0075738, partial [Trifolium medium]|nr:hypothetical protein [Trifolium medium]
MNRSNRLSVKVTRELGKGSMSWCRRCLAGDSDWAVVMAKLNARDTIIRQKWSKRAKPLYSKDYICAMYG